MRLSEKITECVDELKGYTLEHAQLMNVDHTKLYDEELKAYREVRSRLMISMSVALSRLKTAEKDFLDSVEQK